ncbi:MAG TPA: hypothetical protein VH415_08270 [Nitrososphaeraceae archaeon]
MSERNWLSSVLVLCDFLFCLNFAIAKQASISKDANPIPAKTIVAKSTIRRKSNQKLSIWGRRVLADGLTF